jgi:hypothetical protein
MGADPQNEDKWMPIVHEDFSTVTMDNGRPANPCLNATFLPTLSVTEDGAIVQLGATFTSGQAWFRNFATGHMKSAVDVTRWSFTVPIRLDFGKMASGDIAKAPKVVRDRLEHFSSAGFAVSRLFCDLQSVDLLGTGLSSVSVSSETSDNDKAMFNIFILTGYLPYIKAHPDSNPYILGYVAKHTSATSADQDRGVPDSLKPIGNAFNVFNDRSDPSLSTLNFILNTKTSPIAAGDHPAVDSFDTNWIKPGDVGQAKMIYSFRAFIEGLILKEFYQKYAESFHNQISTAGISIGPDSSYEQAIKPNADGNGCTFEICNVRSGDDQYANSFEVRWSTTSTGISLDFTGSIHWYMERSKHVTILGKTEKARAWAGCDSTWATSIKVDLVHETNGDGESRAFLKITTEPMRNTGSVPWHDHNGVDGSLSTISDLIGGLIAAGGIFEMFSSNIWVEAGLFALFLIKIPSEVKVNGFPLDFSLKALSQDVPSKVILPAGDVFEFKNLSVSQEGQARMMLDYRPEVR